LISVKPRRGLRHIKEGGLSELNLGSIIRRCDDQVGNVSGVTPVRNLLLGRPTVAPDHRPESLGDRHQSIGLEMNETTANANWLTLQLIRSIHTAIYVVMAASTLLLVYAGVTGATGWWLWSALGLLAIESVVFVAYGFKCPLTGLAVKYGARTGHVFDTFLPERATRYTFRFFGTLMGLGLLLLALRWNGLVS
jgi:hypothetical protein